MATPERTVRPIDRKVIAVLKRFDIRSRHGLRVFYPGEPFAVAKDQFEWFMESQRHNILNLTPRLLTPIEALVPFLFGDDE